MKKNNIFYFVAVLNLISALLWLTIPNAAKFVGFAVFVLAAFFSFMAARQSR